MAFARVGLERGFNSLGRRKLPMEQGVRLSASARGARVGHITSAWMQTGRMEGSSSTARSVELP
eukprot:14395774-Alexandrium_andersonii.AAC.1